jgi:hypothetical protein
LRLSIALALRHHFFGEFARVFLILFVRNFNLLFGILQRDRLEEVVDAACRHQSVRHGRVRIVEVFRGHRL